VEITSSTKDRFFLTTNPNENSVPLLQQPPFEGCCFKSSQIFGLLKILLGVISWSINQDLDDRAIFLPISYLFVFFTLHCYFGFVIAIGESNPFSYFLIPCSLSLFGGTESGTSWGVNVRNR
jgi:hypothetical protein